MTIQELYKKGEFLFGNDFRKIANCLPHLPRLVFRGLVLELVGILTT